MCALCNDYENNKLVQTSNYPLRFDNHITIKLCECVNDDIKSNFLCVYIYLYGEFYLSIVKLDTFSTSESSNQDQRLKFKARILFAFRTPLISKRLVLDKPKQNIPT